MSSKLIHVEMCVRISFQGWKVFHCYLHTFCLPHSSVDGRLGCFHLLAVVNNATMNMTLEQGLQDLAFNSSGYILRNGIAVSYSNSFNFGRGSSYTNLLFHQQCIRVQISPQACQGLFSVYLIIAC